MTTNYSSNFVHKFVLNDSLCPLSLRADGPSNAAAVASSAPDLSGDSSNSYNDDDAHRYLQEWRMAKDSYSEVTQENGRLETCLGVIEVALHATEEETNAAWPKLADADARVAGEFFCFRENPHPCFLNLIT